MLESIYIENFAIIDQLTIDFHKGMTVITGETGAGKSIIIDAIGQLTGNRVQTSLIKDGCNEAFIEGVFTINDKSKLFEQLDAYRITYDDKLIISKSFNRDNKTTIKINYRTVTKSVLQTIMNQLIDIHSQFETHQLFDEANHLEILDTYIGEAIDTLKQEYIHAYQTYKNTLKNYDKAINEELNDEQLEFYQTQLSEINNLDIENINEVELEIEKKQLQNYEKTNMIISNYRQHMSGHQGVISMLNNALNELEKLNYQQEYATVYEKMYDLYYNLIDLDDAVHTEFNSTDFDEYRLNEIQDTQFKLNRLKRKYGSSIEAILNTRKEIESKIVAFNNRENFLKDLKRQLNKSQAQVEQLANQITSIRKEYANKFANEVTGELNSMYLSNVTFSVVLKKTSLKKIGQDDISFFVSTNQGENVKPLNKVASGGELSRIILAIKTILIKINTIETIVFDEVDTGVSGKVAESIGLKMKKIATTNQVLCITHLAQVAAIAENHLLITKILDNEKTNVKIQELNRQDSIKEIAKLISGKDISRESIEHAKKLKDANE